VAERVRAFARLGARASARDALVDWVHAEPALAARGPAAIALARDLGDREAATELAERVAAERPASVEPRLVLAHLLLEDDREARADLEIEQALHSATDRAAAMAQAADVYDQTGRHRKACVLRARALAFLDGPAARARVSACQRALDEKLAGAGATPPATGAAP
jgi:predicted Zn-dependent protease